ncbi:hypothetical protein PN465_01525 [Nodularia spumigena CS-584]|nr:hypothetical protein [Nodularia spumigena CS-584]
MDVLEEKEQLEIEKIKSEIVELRKPWFKKPIWIAALSSLILGTTTLIVASTNGFLQARSTLNKIEKENLLRKKDRLIEL